MEDMVTKLFNGIYKNKRVLITGHTGFKGSWLMYWLNLLGANTLGFALEPHTKPNHFSLLELKNTTKFGNLSDVIGISKIINEFQPEFVFHLGAQAIVRYSYTKPLETFHTNIIGTANLLEACRRVKSVKSVVIVTTDKCYENKEWAWGYREIDSLGGYDPYSSSKACCEFITASYRNSFFNTNEYKKSHNVLIATARAGNVIGGGDWGHDRLIPDIIRSINEEEILNIRNPFASRPWQHVLDAITGYLILGQKLYEGNVEMSGPWNFGPIDNSVTTVLDILNIVKSLIPAFHYKTNATEKLYETKSLHLDSTKANTKLNWIPVWSQQHSIKKTINWYKYFYENNDILTQPDLFEYMNDAKQQKMQWVTS